MVAVFRVLVFGQDFLIGLVGLFEPPDGFQHEGIYHLFVIVPVETLLLEQGIQFGIILNELFVQLAPYLAVGLITIVRVGHVCLVGFRLLNLVAYLSNELNVVIPG